MSKFVYLKANTLILCLFLGVMSQSCFDQCRKVDCNNSGYCYDGACICDKWYSGENCDLRFNRNYEGLFQSSMDLMARNEIDTIRFFAHQSIPNRVYTTGGLQIDFETDSTLIIPVQELIIDSMQFSIEGSGQFGLDFYEIEYGLSGEYDPLDSRTSIYNFSGTRVAE